MASITQEPSIGRLILLPEDEATRTFFDSGNCRTLFRLLLVALPAALAIAVAMAAQERYAELSVPALNLLVIRVLFAWRERDVFSRHFRPLLLAYLVIQTLLWKAAFFAPAATWHPADFAAPVFFVFFRLAPGALAIPLGAAWALSVGRHLITAALGFTELEYGYVIAQTAVTAVVFSIVRDATRKKRRDFLVNWRRELHRHREQRRMQEELDDARKIQLSMLPRSEPRIPWLETAGISIPASEVGGDYYDYFTISATRQAIVVGDVAGHGVASGLLLSGVRSCLHLLHEAPVAPVEVLGKIDRMLRRTIVQRGFVTLLYALFDYERRSLTFAAAGHPPLLRLRGLDGSVEELELHALPLGTRLGSQPQERTVTIADDDVFVLFTDGIAETVNAHGEVYGADRLQKLLRRISPRRTAREIRDTVLGDVWTFKADGLQLDDITIVVARVRAPAA